MSWFKHKHWWRVKSDNIIKESDGRTRAQLILEDCSCGAVRTIEVEPGKAPVVRIGYDPTGEA